MGLREEKKQRLREAILERAESLFREQGFEATRVRDIIRPLAISEPTFFNYFPSKQALLDELALERLRRDTREIAAVAGGDPQLPILEGLAGAFQPQIRAMEQDRDFMRLLFTRSSLWNPSGSMRGMHAERGHPMHELTRGGFAAIAGVIEAAQARGEVRAELNPQRVAEVVFGVFRTTTTLWLTDYWDDDDDLETRLRSAFDALWNGVASQNSP